MGILDTIQNTVGGIFKSKECDCDKPVSEPVATTEQPSAPTVGGRRRRRRRTKRKSRRRKSRRRKSRRRRTRRRRRRRR